MYVLYGIGQVKTHNKLATYRRTICELTIFEIKEIKLEMVHFRTMQ